MIDSILPGFAALDLGATKIFAAAATTPVKTFGTFTGELRALCAWLTEHQVHSVAMEATGVYWIPVHDATLLPGISPLGWMKLTAELGPDLSAFADEHHFAAWCGLVPQRHQSGRRQRRQPRPKTAVGQIFREAVPSLAKSKHLALGGFYRRIKGRRGAAVAVVATARKLAVLFYRAMTRGLEYVERGLAEYEAAYRAQSERHLRKMAARLGFILQSKTT